VREGDTVEAGQILLELDDTAARAELQRLILRRVRLTAIDARLQAEMREEQDITLPSDIVNWLANSPLANSPEVKEIVDSQQMTFTARRNNLNSDVKSIQESINALEERIRGSRVQLDAVHRQIVLLDEEIVTKDKLVQAGLVRKPELMVLQRSKANLEGEVGRIMGDIGDAKERIARALEQINGVRKTAIKTAVEQMHEIRGELADVRERMLAPRASSIGSESRRR
jgi:multidrug resistance efflux pump